MVVLGEAAHPEVGGILGTVGSAVVVSRAEEIAPLPKRKGYGLVAQTTQTLNNLQRVASALLTKTKELKVHNTICNATTDLQEETRELAAEVDRMIVVGGRNSANTSRLAAISREAGVETRHVETADEIDAAWLQGAGTVGVTAGTSTPDWIIEAILARLHAVGGRGA